LNVRIKCVNALLRPALRGACPHFPSCCATERDHFEILKHTATKGVGRKIFRRGPTEKRQKNSKKDRKIALLNLFQRATKKTEK